MGSLYIFTNAFFFLFWNSFDCFFFLFNCTATRIVRSNIRKNERKSFVASFHLCGFLSVCCSLYTAWPYLPHFDETSSTLLLAVVVKLRTRLTMYRLVLIMYTPWITGTTQKEKVSTFSKECEGEIYRRQTRWCSGKLSGTVRNDIDDSWCSQLYGRISFLLVG